VPLCADAMPRPPPRRELGGSHTPQVVLQKVHPHSAVSISSDRSAGEILGDALAVYFRRDTQVLSAARCAEMTSRVA
jgi:hypothetical protein